MKWAGRRIGFDFQGQRVSGYAWAGGRVSVRYIEPVCIRFHLYLLFYYMVWTVEWVLLDPPIALNTWSRLAN